MAGARPPDAAAARHFCALPRDLQEAPGGRGRGRAAAAGGRADPPGRTAMARVCRSARPSPRVRVVSVHDCRRRTQFRPRPCAAEGRAGASPPHIPWPRVRSVPVHGRRGVRSSGRGRARRRDGLALPHPTSHGRAFASFLCTIAAGVRGGGTGWRFLTPHPVAALAAARAQARAFAALLCTIAAACAVPAARAAALKSIPCAGRICAYSRCAAAASASAQSVRSQGRSRSARPKWP